MTDNRPTEQLHKLLEERGVEYEAYRDIKNRRITKWRTYHGAFVFFAVEKEGRLFVETASDTGHSAICTPEQTIAATLGSEINGDTSDGYHTFNELYHHRAVLFSVIVRDHRDLAWKARKHHDGTMYEGMFIVGIETPKGQATYHYDLDPYWDMFDCEEREFAPEWDGHTPEEAIARIAELGSELNPDGLPVGLTISEDGDLLNWRGENYVKQSTLWSERDEWKERYDSVLEGRDRWSGIVDGIYRRFYPREKYCLPIDPTDMINEAIDAIERERDEWKAKAIVATLGNERGNDVIAFERK